MYDCVDPQKSRAEVEKGLTKLRWERLSADQSKNNNNNDAAGGELITINNDMDTEGNNNTGEVRNNEYTEGETNVINNDADAETIDNTEGERNDSDDTDRTIGNNDEEGDVRNIIDFRKTKATDFDFNRRVYLPPLKQETELQLQLLKTNLQRIREVYEDDDPYGDFNRT